MAPFVAVELDLARSPGVVLIAALAAAHLPMLARAVILARGPAQPRLADAAIESGRTRRTAAVARDGHPLRRIPLRPAP
jgi:hypothetical protein